MHMVLETTSILPSGSTLYTNAVSLEMSDEPKKEYLFIALIKKAELSDAYLNSGYRQVTCTKTSIAIHALET